MVKISIRALKSILKLVKITGSTSNAAEWRIPVLIFQIVFRQKQDSKMLKFVK